MSSDLLAEQVRAELMPLLETLLGLLPDGDDPTRVFFARIRKRVETARLEEDVAETFMELSTAAFVLDTSMLGPEAAVWIDRVLERAQGIAATLSAESDLEH